MNGTFTVEIINHRSNDTNASTDAHKNINRLVHNRKTQKRCKVKETLS